MAIIEKKAIISPEAEQPFDNLIKQYDILIAKNNELVKSSTNLQKAFTEVSKAQTSDGAEAKKLVDINQKLIKNNTDLTTIQKERIKIRTQLDNVLAKSQVAQELNNKQLIKAKIAGQETTKAIQQLAKEELGLISVYDRLAKKTLEAQKNFKNLAAQFGVNSKQAKAAQQEFKKLETQLSGINKAAKDGRPFVGRYSDALKGFGQQLLGAFGIVGGVQLLIDGFKKLIETSKQVNDITQKLRSTFQLSTKESKAYAAEILAISDTFDQDYNEVLNSAITVSKELGISVQDATKFIEEGFLKGSNNSGQFLDILKEYPTQFKAAGIDAETMFSIINQQVKEGIYSDKGVDAIKEGGLRLRENTKAVQAALAPLDDFTKAQIEQEVAAGNSFKAIQLVSKALNDTSLTASETQAIIADVFGGPGEDAGLRYLQMLQNVNENLDNVEIQASESEQATLNLNRSWDSFVAGVSDSDGIFSKVWATIKNLLAGAIAGLSKLLDLINGPEPAKVIKKLKDLEVTRQEDIKTDKKKEESTKKLTSAQIEANKASAEALRLAQERKKIDDDNATLNLNNAEIKGVESVESQIAKIQEDFRLNKLKDLNQNIADEQRRQAEDEIQRAQDIEDQKQAIKEAAIDAVSDYAKNASDLIIDSNLQKTKDQVEAEKEILKDKLDKGLISEAEYNNKLRQLNNKERLAEARADKKKALFDIAINTAVAVVKALPNLIKVAGAIAIGGIQAAAVAARPLPKFAKGEINIKGKSHSEGGIVAEIEGGESVITKKGTANAPETLDLINKGMLTDEQILTRKPNYNGLIYKQLGKLNRTNEQILQATENGVSQYEDNGVIYTIFATGRKNVRFKQ